MPVEYQIDHESQFVCARAAGVVVLDDILDSLDAVIVHDAASYRKLIDAREAIPQLSDDDFMVLAARVSAYAAFKPRGAVAFVATAYDAVGAFRRYANFMGGQDRPIRMFLSVEDARQWLEQDEARAPAHAEQE